MNAVEESKDRLSRIADYLKGDCKENEEINTVPTGNFLDSSKQEYAAWAALPDVRDAMKEDENDGDLNSNWLARTFAEHLDSINIYDIKVSTSRGNKTFLFDKDGQTEIAVKQTFSKGQMKIVTTWHGKRGIMGMMSMMANSLEKWTTA